jgi:hypothetical protein
MLLISQNNDFSIKLESINGVFVTETDNPKIWAVMAIGYDTPLGLYSNYKVAQSIYSFLNNLIISGGLGSNSDKWRLPPSNISDLTDYILYH